MSTFLFWYSVILISIANACCILLMISHDKVQERFTNVIVLLGNCGILVYILFYSVPK